MNVKYVLSISLLGGVFLVNQAHADDNVISTIVNAKNGGFNLNGSDSLTITETGEIDVTVAGTHAIHSTGNGNTIINQGSLSINGVHKYGIYLDNSNNNNITQSGSISTTGTFAFGIYLDHANNNYVTQSGIISTSGDNARGIYLLYAHNNNVIQSGNISTTGSGAYGIFLWEADNNYVTQSGSISTSMDDTYGIYLNYAHKNNVIQSGNISTSGEDAHGIYVYGANNNYVTQSGIISTSGDNAYGIYLEDANNNNVTQSGSISTSGSSAYGIYLNNADNNNITQSGSISTSGSSAYGISLEDADNNYVTQSGSISTSGDNAYGVVLYNAEDNNVIQSGSISTSRTFAHGIYLNNADNNNITQSGNISTTGSNARGISLFNADNSNITQTGSISTIGSLAYGIYLNGSDNSTFNISGLITSAQSNAILFTDDSDGNTLNLTTEAFLGGAINLGAGGGGNFVNISTTPSHSVIWDFGAASEITNGIQVSGSGAYLVNGNIFYSLDTTGFFARADALGDTANLLSGVAASRLGSGSSLTTFEQAAGFAYTQDDGSVDYSDARFWGDFIGSTSHYGATKTTLDYNNHRYGLALGYERDFDAATTFGLMGGYLGGKIKAESRFITSQEIDTQGGFAGVYGSHEFADEITLSGSLIAGRSNNDSKRTFNNNTVVPAFTETASGTYDSTFIAPSISISKDYALDERTTLTPSLSALYAHQWSEGYTETGSSTNLTVGSGQSRVFEAKGELGITRRIEATERHNGGHITARLGAMVRATPNNDTPTLSFAGIGTLTNASNDKGSLVAATAGLDFSFQIKDNISLTASSDIAVGNNNYFNAQGKLGIKVRF